MSLEGPTLVSAESVPSVSRFPYQPPDAQVPFSVTPFCVPGTFLPLNGTGLSQWTRSLEPLTPAKARVLSAPRGS